jgi:hypothetical protein
MNQFFSQKWVPVFQELTSLVYKAITDVARKVFERRVVPCQLSKLPLLFMLPLSGPGSLRVY